MKKRLIITIFTFSVGIMHTASAEKVKTAASAKASAPAPTQNNMELMVSYGDKTSYFKVQQRGGAHKLVFSNNQGAKRTVLLSQKDFDYLMRTSQPLLAKPSDKGPCLRSHLRLTVFSQEDTKSVFGCIRSRSQLSKDLRGLADLMTIIL